jgi:hypothetical protein
MVKKVRTENMSFNEVKSFPESPAQVEPRSIPLQEHTRILTEWDRQKRLDIEALEGEVRDKQVTINSLHTVIAVLGRRIQDGH